MTASWSLLGGDCRTVLAQLDEAIVDACVTDPPYELGFMGKAWDKSGVAFDPETWRAVFRVLKPGGHLLAFGGTRTVHRIACAIEDAGFDIRDQLQWLYGSGFPKSLDVAKQDGCAEWEGWGTALKPACEPIVLARKPLIGTVAANVLAHGTGGLNIDGSRVEGRERTNYGLDNATRSQGSVYGTPSVSANFDASKGRWPSNVLLDEEAAALLDKQSGERKSGGKPGKSYMAPNDGYEGWGNLGALGSGRCTGDTGGASRFFYVAKASRSERDAGLDHMPVRTGGEAVDREDESAGLNSPRAGAGRRGGARNFHPTVKPIDVMRWLVRLVTPLGGLVLDPFAGSGTTGIAALREGARFVGIDLETEYARIAIARIEEDAPLFNRKRGA